MKSIICGGRRFDYSEPITRAEFDYIINETFDMGYDSNDVAEALFPNLEDWDLTPPAPVAKYAVPPPVEEGEDVTF